MLVHRFELVFEEAVIPELFLCMRPGIKFFEKRDYCAISRRKHNNWLRKKPGNSNGICEDNLFSWMFSWIFYDMLLAIARHRFASKYLKRK